MKSDSGDDRLFKNLRFTRDKTETLPAAAYGFLFGKRCPDRFGRGCRALFGMLFFFLEIHKALEKTDSCFGSGFLIDGCNISLQNTAGYV